MGGLVFTLRGKGYQLDRNDVIKAMRGVEPEPVRTHAVKIGGRAYPPKQVLAEVLKVDRLDVTTADARSILKRLGFELERL